MKNPKQDSLREISYRQATERLMSLADFERSARHPNHTAFHLNRIRCLMNRLGDPYLNIPTIHIAGTKGKGSTAAMITSILKAHGHTVGLYTSPALHKMTERIRIGLDPICERKFAALVEQIWSISQDVSEEDGFGPVTFFEFITAMAFLCFQQEDVDYQVIEVGLGGRLDATNIVYPTVTAITRIMLDHTSVLGTTLSQIAAEKAGIIKKEAPVVMAPQPLEAAAVFRKTAGLLKTRLVEVGRDITWTKRNALPGIQSFDVKGRHHHYEANMHLIGDFQQENAVTAIALAETLMDLGLGLSKQTVERGLFNVKWPARLQSKFFKDRRLLIDGAHNPHAVRALVSALRQHFIFDRALVVFGSTRGHNLDGMIAEMEPLCPKLFPVSSRHPRAEPYRIVTEAAVRKGLDVEIGRAEVSKALNKALRVSSNNDIILGTGSLSVAAEILEEIDGIVPEVYPVIDKN